MLFTPYGRNRSEKLHKVARKLSFATVFTKSRELGSQFRPKIKEPNVASGVVYEVNCNDCTKVYSKETGRKSTETIKEHRSDDEKDKKKENITGLSQHMRETGHKTA